MIRSLATANAMTRSLLGAALGFVLVVAATGVGYLARDRAGLPAAPAAGGTGSAPTALAETLQAAFVGVAQQVRPAVVNIGTIQRSKTRRPMGPQPGSDDPFFRDFFKQFFGSEGPGQRPEFRQPSLGSGVIIDKRGLVLTNFHVIRGADEITVRLSDKREYRGKVMGTDPKTDLAVVRFDPDHELRVASLGDSDALKVGEWAIAIGNPFGLDQTVTVGVVSATGRSDVGVATYENFIQTDASINPGNSGGPLLNLKGEVIGINTAIVAAGQGIGFAIPINMVKRVVDQLVEKGKVVRGWLGVSIRDVAKDLKVAQSFNYDGTTGVLVYQVLPGTPAIGKLQPGDIITAINGKPVQSVQELRTAIAAMPPGEQIKMSIFRNGKGQEVAVNLAEQPDNVLAMRGNPREEKAPKTEATTSADSLGIKVQTLTAEMAKRNNLDLKAGAVVMRVTRNSPAARAGLVPGDVITQVGKSSVESADELLSALEKEDLKKGVRLYVTNGDASRFVVVSSEK